MPTTVFFDLGNTLVTLGDSGHPPKLRLQPMAGSADLLASLRAAEFRIGIISNTGQDTGANVNRALADAGLLDHFEEGLRVYSGDLPHLQPKPHPDLFEEAKTRSGAARIIFVGENAAERAAAHAVGFETLDIGEVRDALLP